MQARVKELLGASGSRPTCTLKSLLLLTLKLALFGHVTVVIETAGHACGCASTTHLTSLCPVEGIIHVSLLDDISTFSLHVLVCHFIDQLCPLSQIFVVSFLSHHHAKQKEQKTHERRKFKTLESLHLQVEHIGIL